MLLVNTRKESRNVHESNEWNVERIACTNETCSLFARFNVENTSECHWLVANNTDCHSIKTCETARNAGCPVLEVFEVLTVVTHFANDLLHVIRLVW